MVDAALWEPGALAAQTPVYSYFAPDSLGSGTVTVRFNGEDQTWDPDAESSCPPCDGRVQRGPELLSGVGPRQAHYWRILLAVTEYAEQSVEIQWDNIPRYLQGM